MRIVVSTPTGNIGRSVVERLLDGGGAEVVVIHRDPAKLGHLTARGVEARQGSLEDEGFLAAAIAGADALLWVTPLAPQASNLRAAQNQLGIAVSRAVQAGGIGRVVNISSIGAQHDEGTGPVAGLHDVEEMLDACGAEVLHLRPGFFFENYLVQVQVIEAMGVIMMPVPGAATIPMIAARDIAAVAATKLLGERWAPGILELHGPADLSFDEAAAAISEAIGKQVPHREADEMQARIGWSMMGLGAGVVDSFLELYRAIASGHLRAEGPRTAETTTPTTLVEWASEALPPRFG